MHNQTAGQVVQQRAMLISLSSAGHRVGKPCNSRPTHYSGCRGRKGQKCDHLGCGTWLWGCVYKRQTQMFYMLPSITPHTVIFSYQERRSWKSGISRWMLWFRFHNVFRDSQQFRLWLLGTLSSYCLSLGSPTGSTGAWGLFIDLLTMIHGQCRDVFSVPGL